MKNKKVMDILINILANNVLYKIGKYNDIHYLWEKLIKIHENPSLIQKEEESKEIGSLVQEMVDSEVERHITYEVEVEKVLTSSSKMEVEKVFTSMIEREERSLTLK